MTYGDSLARGLAVRLIREETERFTRRVNARTFHPPAKSGRWFKAVVRDLQTTLKDGIVYEGFVEEGKRAKYAFITLELWEGDFLGFTTYIADKGRKRVETFETPIKLTLHVIQRLIQGGMEPNIKSLVAYLRPILRTITDNIHAQGIPHRGTEIQLLTATALVGCVVSGKGEIIVRTWIPRNNLTKKQVETIQRKAREQIHIPDPAIGPGQ